LILPVVELLEVFLAVIALSLLYLAFQINRLKKLEARFEKVEKKLEVEEKELEEDIEKLGKKK
jgi:uncharacterized protein YoxC